MKFIVWGDSKGKENGINKKALNSVLKEAKNLYPQDRDDFWEAVEKCDIDLVICGHEHNYSRRLIKSSYNNKDIYQIISGGAGEKLKNKYHSKSGVVVAPIAVYHFLIINVDKSSIKLCAITNKGRKIDEFIIDTNK